MKLIPAGQLTIEELTAAYNESRTDYIVPMPMSVARLQTYIEVYDVDLDASCVVVDGRQPLGLGLLGTRGRQGWITRLGVLPQARRRGVGGILMNGLMANARSRRFDAVWLEVIKGNEPAHALFHRFGFDDIRELLIVRRPPDPQLPTRLQESDAIPPLVRILDHEAALDCLARRRRRPNWLNETATYRHVRNLLGMVVTLPDGQSGWAVYHAGLMQLTRLVVDIIQGNPTTVVSHVLQEVHRRHPNQDSIIENIPQDERWPGFHDSGYFETFRRIEMKCQL